MTARKTTPQPTETPIEAPEAASQSLDWLKDAVAPQPLDWLSDRRTVELHLFAQVLAVLAARGMPPDEAAALAQTYAIAGTQLYF